jgi:uncharacterized protein (TIGR02757 family)
LTDSLKVLLESLYHTWNRREYVHPDPLEFLYGYNDLRDREIVGLIASGLAYGRVRQILKSVGTVLKQMGPNPSGAILPQLRESLLGFRHRFTTGAEIIAMLEGALSVQAAHGSIGAFVSEHTRESGILEAQRALVNRITGGGRVGSLLPCPSRGSCCKRLNMWFRWMARHDEVDPGGWDEVPGSLLLIPLDTHMWKVGCRLGFTNRKAPDLKAVMEITEGFRGLCPEDPVRYDFTLTRFGIRDELCLDSLLSRLDR